MEQVSPLENTTSWRSIFVSRFLLHGPASEVSVVQDPKERTLSLLLPMYFC